MRFPVAWQNIQFDRLEDGREANLEPAVEQLERYRRLLTYWCDHNVSCTISYDRDEVPQVIDWFEEHWDQYVGVSFLFRADPNARAQELGYAYLPQEVITEEEYSAYVSRLGEVALGTAGDDEPETRDCPVAACPVR